MQGNGKCAEAGISRDGNSIVFVSDATNLVDGANGQANVYLCDMTTGTLTLISTNADGPCGGASISGDGNVIAFITDADNMQAGDVNKASDIYIYMRQACYNHQAGSLQRIGSPVGGTQSGGKTALSDTGRFIVFASEATNLTTVSLNGFRNIYMFDQNTQVMRCVSLATDGSEPLPANGDSWAPTINNDQTVMDGEGRYIYFTSEATDLAENGNNGQAAIYCVNTHNWSTSLVNINPDGCQISTPSWNPTISGDGSIQGYITEGMNTITASFLVIVNQTMKKFMRGIHR